MSQSITPESVLCSETLIQICNGNKEFARTLLDKFKHSAPVQVAEIRQAFSSDDPDSMRATAHSLKGASAVMGALIISDKAAEIEEVAKTGNIDSIESNIDKLQELVEQASKVEF